MGRSDLFDFDNCRIHWPMAMSKARLIFIARPQINAAQTVDRVAGSRPPAAIDSGINHNDTRHKESGLSVSVSLWLNLTRENITGNNHLWLSRRGVRRNKPGRKIRAGRQAAHRNRQRAGDLRGRVAADDPSSTAAASHAGISNQAAGA